AAAAVVAIIDGRQASLAWATLAVAGSLLALARALGPLWLPLGAAATLVVAGWPRAREVVRGSGRRGLIVVGVLVAAFAIATAWDAAVMPHTHAGLEVARHYAHRGVNDLPLQLEEIVGVVGFIDVRLPPRARLTGELALGLAA